MTARMLLELQDARVIRDGRVILHVERLTVAEGERVAVLGPNGAGKSTLVGMLTGDVKPVWSETPPVRFRGQRLWDLAAARREIGVVSYSMQETLERGITARDAVLGGLWGAIGIPVHRSPSADQIELAEAALEALGAESLADRTMFTLSTGEARRVTIARALVTQPSVLVLDEPTAGLDPGAAHEVRASVAQLAAAGTSMLLVTHHIEDLPPSIDRVLFIADGHMTADGPPAELISGERLSALFGAPLDVSRTHGGGWQLGNFPRD